jgi:cell shape-determining protein MreD
MKHKIISGITVTIGYLLSPLSWWNDLFINIPIAYGFAFLFSLISKNLFTPMIVIGYWITNIAGFMLMHQGAKGFIRQNESGYNKKELMKDLIFSILYTLIIIVLIKLELVKFPTEYFK